MTRSTKTRSQKTKGNNSFAAWMIAIALIVIATVVAIIGFNGGETVASTPPPDLPEGWVSGKVLGNPEASVTVQAWEDFLCPACRQWNEQIKPQLFEEYIKSGKVKLEFHQFPLQIHAPGSFMGANASECAAEQGAFWQFHDQLFAAAGSNGQAGFTIDSLAQFADALGLDTGDFVACMSSQKYRAEVDASVSTAFGMNLNSTPSILINDKLLENPFEYALLATEIEGALQSAGSQ